MPARSQSSQSAQNHSLLAGPVSLPLSKFSYATVPAESITPIPWTHLSSHGNLFVAFDITRVQRLDGGIEEQSELKIVNGSDRLVLVEIKTRCLESLIDSKDVLQLDILGQEAMKTKNSPPTTNQHSTTIIVRVPCLAVRYPLAQRQIRRIQMRFTKETDYYRALQLLSEAGCPLEPAASPPPRPQTRPVSSASTLVENGKQDPRDSSNVYTAPKESVGTISNEHRSCVAEFPTIAPVSAPPSKPSASPLFEAPISHVITRQSQFGSDQQRYIQLERLHSETWDRSEHISPDAPPKVQPENSQTSPVRNSSIGDLLYAPRPSTAPAMQSQGTIDRILPPPRDLPFQKPVSRTTPREIQPWPLQTNTSHVDHQAEESPLEMPNATVTNDGMSETRPPPKRSRKGPSDSRKKSKTSQQPRVPSVDELLARDQDGKSTESSVQPRSAIILSEKDHKVRLAKALSPFHKDGLRERIVPEGNASPVVIIENSQPEVPARATATASFEGSLLALPDSRNPPPQPSNQSAQTPSRIAESFQSSDLSHYAKDDDTNQAERLAAIESFVCAQLKDDGFLRMVKDLETWWPRLLLGKRVLDLNGEERDS